MKDDKVKDFILNTKKRSEITVENTNSGNYIMYRFIKSQLKGYLRVQAKIDNDWNQIGYFDTHNRYHVEDNKQYIHQKDIDKLNSSKLIFQSIVNRYITTLRPFNDIKIHHNGHCSICGKKLSTPESIENGIGPVCEKELNKLLKK